MSTPPVVFPDTEIWATAYLREALAAHGYPGTFVANRRETQVVAVWVRRDGGPGGQVTEQARLGVNVYAATEQAVGDLARTVSALMRAAAGHAQVKHVREVAGPTPIADGKPRRFMSYELVIKGTELT